MNKAGRLTTVWGWSGMSGWEDGHGVGEWVAKGLTMWCCQFSFKEPTQGGLCQDGHEMSGLGGVVFLSGQQKVENSPGWGQGGQGVVNLSNPEKNFSLSLLILWVYLGPESVWSLHRCTEDGCICRAENNWILFTLGQRKIPG